jgi:predicted ABC-type ATPase
MPPLGRRPLIVAIAGPNGAGKSTFYALHVAATALPFVNADVMARELNIDAYAAAGMAASLREQLLSKRKSFVFETVFSDPAGDKLAFLQKAASEGYNVILCFIGTSSADILEDRVALRVAQGGHDVPSEKIRERFPRVLANLKRALATLPSVWVFDNDDFERPYRLVAVYENGQRSRLQPPVPKWLKPLLPPGRTAKAVARP